MTRLEILICDLCGKKDLDFLGKLRLSVSGNSDVDIEICDGCERKILETVRGLKK